MADEKIIDRITKLLAQAEHPNTGQAEAEIFMAKAQELMTEHAIDQLKLRAAGRVQDDRPVTVRIRVAKTWFRPDVALCGAVADANDCRLYYNSPSSWDSHGYLNIVGFPEDVENVQLLYSSLLIQLARFTRGMKAPWWETVSDSSYKRSFRYGFAVGIGMRLAAARETTLKEEPEYEGTLLPALVDKEAEVDAAMPENMKSGRSVTLSSREATRAGIEAADQADVGSPRIGSQAAVGG
jgi:hypothetical protein